MNFTEFFQNRSLSKLNILLDKILSMIKRYPTKQIYVGNIPIGGDAPIPVQSMTFSKTSDVKATVDQITRLHFAGADIVRVAVPNKEAADALKEIKSQVQLPLVADIHFHYKLALIAAEVVDCIRKKSLKFWNRRRLQSTRDLRR